MTDDALGLSNSGDVTRAVYALVGKLVKRGYLNLPCDVKFARPGHKPVQACGRMGPEGPLDLSQLKWAAEHGRFWFHWHEGTDLRLALRKGPVRAELRMDPARENAWEFAYDAVERFE